MDMLLGERLLGRAVTWCLIGAVAIGCGAAAAGPERAAPGAVETGLAAYYADRLHGRKTASGVPYDKNALTAAHRTLPFGTIVEVTSLANRRTVRVEINDRGPFGDRDRIIDLSRAAAERIDMLGAGVTEVRVEVVESPRR
jgi:rare lipoprotein A